MNIKRLTVALIAALTAGISEQAAKNTELPDWQNPQVIQRNRIPMSSYFGAFDEDIGTGGDAGHVTPPSLPQDERSCVGRS